jgi:hypothetical protein
MDDTTNGNTRMLTCWSVRDLADMAGRHAPEEIRNGDRVKFAMVTLEESLTMAREGWRDQLDVAMEIAESAISMALKEHTEDTFAPVWDVTGGAVDVARFLSGEPECMIDFPLTRTSKQGRVITLVVSASYSSALTHDTLIRRGQVITAFALALARLGHAIEIWTDGTPVDMGKGATRLIQRTLIKGVNDELDPAMIMFALGHPSFLRNLMHGTRGILKGKWASFSRNGGRPSPRPADYAATYPEGTIFLPELRTARDIPEADEFLRQYLGELGLLAE